LKFHVREKQNSPVQKETASNQGIPKWKKKNYYHLFKLLTAPPLCQIACKNLDGGKRKTVP